MSGRSGMSAAEKVLLEVGKRVFGNKPGKTQPLIKVLREECFIADEEDGDKDDLNFLLKYTNDGTIGKELKDLGFPRTFVREFEEKLRELGLQVVPYNGGDQAAAAGDAQAAAAAMAAAAEQAAAEQAAAEQAAAEKAAAEKAAAEKAAAEKAAAERAAAEQAAAEQAAAEKAAA